MLGRDLLRRRESPRVQVREEAAGVHLGCEGEGHGVGGDHGGGHTGDPGILRYGVSVTAASEGGGHGVLLVETPVGSLLAGGGPHDLRSS